jgi:hypothetical protein
MANVRRASACLQRAAVPQRHAGRGEGALIASLRLNAAVDFSIGRANIVHVKAAPQPKDF